MPKSYPQLIHNRNHAQPPRPSRRIVLRTYAIIILPNSNPVNYPDSSRVIDTPAQSCYNYDMKKRTARKDSNFVIYVAEHNGLAYIGLTRKGTVSVARAVKERWRRHISRARNEDRDWELYRYIKSGAWDGWTHTVLDIVRGRAEAYALERELVKHMEPELNDQYL